MSAGSAAALIATLVVAQNVPPELRRQQVRLDPALPEILRKGVTRASRAELDPKRGIGNAKRIIESEERKYRGNRELELSLALRKAAMMLRFSFMQNSKLPEGQRIQQALSTFSKLDLTEPGLTTWLERALKMNKDAARRLGKRGRRPLRVAVLTRGTGLERAAIFAALKKPLAKVGFRLQQTKVRSAPYVIKLRSDEVRGKDGKPVVRVTFDAEHREDGKTTWQRSMYRTSASPDVRMAIRSNVDWLVRIGGRELLFHILSEAGMPMVLIPKQGHGAGHKDHGASSR